MRYCSHFGPRKINTLSKKSTAGHKRRLVIFQEGPWHQCRGEVFRLPLNKISWPSSLRFVVTCSEDARIHSRDVLWVWAVIELRKIWLVLFEKRTLLSRAVQINFQEKVDLSFVFSDCKQNQPPNIKFEYYQKSVVCHQDENKSKKKI